MGPGLVTFFSAAALAQTPTPADCPVPIAEELEVILDIAGKRDVILVDHRGSGYSKPYYVLVLDCGELPLSVLSDRVDRYLEGKTREK